MMRGFAGLVALVVLGSSCSAAPEPEQGFAMIAPPQYIGASVFLNGQEVGRLHSLDTHESFLDAVVNKIRRRPPRHDNAVLVVEVPAPLPSDEQHVRVEKSGLAAASGSFRYSGERFATLYVNGSAVEDARR